MPPVSSARRVRVRRARDSQEAPEMGGRRCAGSVSNVEMAALMALIYKALFPSISTFETPPKQHSDFFCMIWTTRFSLFVV
jgi:hypothetical protein